jgi:hypothetical protein
LYKAKKTTCQALVNNLTSLFDQYGLRRRIIVYVEDEVSNLNAMTITIKSIMKCEAFGLDESFQGTCFDHVFSINEKICKKLRFVSIKST